jgi:DNA processing protein
METLTQLSPAEFPALLREIPDPPKQLWARGNTDLLSNPITKLLTVVGSRAYTSYGKQAVDYLIGGLAGYPIVVISGLALGTDALAHKAALRAGIPTVAVPGSGLSWEKIAPRSNHALARGILEAGGALLSEYAPEQEAAPWTFPQRNRIMAGIAHATLVIEAAERSGTLITSRLATDYNRDVLAVPGPIFNETSRGTHMLIRLGATPITCAGDILDALSIPHDQPASERTNLTKEERGVLDALTSPSPRDELIRILGMSASDANALLSVMEIKGLIKEEFGEIRRT